MERRAWLFRHKLTTLRSKKFGRGWDLSLVMLITLSTNGLISDNIPSKIWRLWILGELTAKQATQALRLRSFI